MNDTLRRLREDDNNLYGETGPSNVGWLTEVNGEAEALERLGRDDTPPPGKGPRLHWAALHAHGNDHFTVWLRRKGTTDIERTEHASYGDVKEYLRTILSAETRRAPAFAGDGRPAPMRQAAKGEGHAERTVERRPVGCR